MNNEGVDGVDGSYTAQGPVKQDEPKEYTLTRHELREMLKQAWTEGTVAAQNALLDPARPGIPNCPYDE